MQRAENFIVLRRKPVPVCCAPIDRDIDLTSGLGLRYIFLNHEYPHRDYAQAQDRGFHHPVGYFGLD